MITNLPGCTPMKPGAASLPMFGVRPVVVDPSSGEVIAGNDVEGVTLTLTRTLTLTLTLALALTLALTLTRRPRRRRRRCS